MTLPVESQVCAIEPFRYQATPQAGPDDGASSNQINEQHLEDYLARLRTSICTDIEAIIAAATAGAGVTSFLGLNDTPDSYAGSGGFAVAVKGDESGLEFTPFPTQTLEPIPLTGRLIVLLKPTSGTTLAASSFSTVGHNQIAVAGSTLSHPVPGTANVLDGIYRLRINSAAVAGVVASVRQSTGTCLGAAGWRMIARWGTPTALAQQRFFVGLINQPGAIANVNPSTLTNLVGFSYDSAQTNLFFIHNDNALAASVIDLGASFPVNTGTFFEMEIEMAPGSGTVDYRLLNVGTGAVATGSVNTDLPADTVLLNLYIWANNGTTAASVSLDTQCLYVEHYQ